MKILFNLLTLLALLATGVCGDKTVIHECGFKSKKDNQKLVLHDDLICKKNKDGIKIVHSGVKLDCNGYVVKYEGSSGSGVDGIIVDGSDAYNVKITDCFAENWPEDAIIVVNGAEAKLNNCKGVKSKRYGLRIQGSGTSAKVDGSTFKQNKKDGIFVEGGAKANINDGRVKYNKRYGLNVKDKATSVKVQGQSSDFKENDEKDIYLDAGAGLQIDNMKKSLEINVKN